MQKQSQVQSGVYRSVASSDKTTGQSDTPHLLTPPTERDLGGREAGGRDGGVQMGQSDGKGRGGGVRLYADGADAAQREMPPSPVSVPSPLPPPSHSSGASLPSSPAVPPNISSSKVGIKNSQQDVPHASTYLHIGRARSKEERGGGYVPGTTERTGKTGVRGEERGRPRSVATPPKQPIWLNDGGAGGTHQEWASGGGQSGPSAGDLGHTLRRGRSPHVQRVLGNRPPQILDFLTSCNCGGSLRWLGMMLAVWPAPPSRWISRTASVSDRNGLQGHRIPIFPGSWGQKSWISSKIFP